MTQETLNYFIKKGFLLDKELLEFFRDFGNRESAEALLDGFALTLKTRIFSKAMISSRFSDVSPIFALLEKDRKEIIEHFFKIGVVESEIKNVEENQHLKPNIFKPDFKILSSKIIPHRRIVVGDFVTHFKNRYNFFRDALKNSIELSNLVSIDKISNSRSFSIIGMVYSKRVTKNNNILIELEDPTGRISAVINQSKPELFEKAKEIVMDDVIGITCMGDRKILFVNDIVFLDSHLQEKKKIDSDVYALFTSDIHFGSKFFLEERFSRFIDWLNGIGCNESQKAILEKIKYLFFVGDNIDGVGIFPGQEDQLKIKDIKEQYIKLAEYFNKIPKHINIIMCPGQHDAVRVPEPQPPVDASFAECLMSIPNLTLVSNPSLIEIESNNKNGGIKVLMYHGASIHGWIEDVEALRLCGGHLHPAKVVSYMLRHRHLSPTHSGTTYVPDETFDSLVIKDVPDIITTGEVHRSDIELYNNILIVCNSCWQSSTPFEEKMGNLPDPCKVPLLNLKTRELKILDFSGK